MKKSIIFILAFALHLCTFASAPDGDVIYINVERWEWLDKPLNKTALYADLMKVLPAERDSTSANWDGYTAYWSIKGKVLQLDRIEVRPYHSFTMTQTNDKLKAIKSSQVIDPSKMALTIRAGRGAVVFYTNEGFNRHYAEEMILTIKKGKVVASQLVHNSKVDGASPDDFQRQMVKSFNFSNFPELDTCRIVWEIKDVKFSKDGKIADCNIDFLRNSITDENRSKALIEEIKETIKAMEPQPTMYILNGKRKSCLEDYYFPLSKALFKNFK